MKTFTVPIFLGVRAETKAEAIEKVLELWEDSMYDLNSEEFPFCDIGLDREVVEQEELK